MASHSIFESKTHYQHREQRLPVFGSEPEVTLRGSALRVAPLSHVWCSWCPWCSLFTQYPLEEAYHKIRKFQKCIWLFLASTNPWLFRLQISLSSKTQWPRGWMPSYYFALIILAIQLMMFSMAICQTSVVRAKLISTIMVNCLHCPFFFFTLLLFIGVFLLIHNKCIHLLDLHANVGVKHSIVSVKKTCPYPQLLRLSNCNSQWSWAL